jgi:anaerobic magnesium-protoporphyrin IX monomethyl ester cyclase
MRICLVRLPSPYLINEKAFPPLGLLSVGTALAVKGHDVFVYDGSMEDVPLDFDYYGLGPTITEYGSALEVKDLIKKHNPAARIVLGGTHATLTPDDCLEDGFDCVVVGDGEAVAETAFSSDATLIFAEEKNLDEYPIIDRSLIDIKSYEYFIDGLLATPVITTKGCPYKCGFCSKVYKTVRFRSADHVKREIDYLHGIGYEALMFFDDTFIVNSKRVHQIASYLKELKITWRCLVRGDLIVKYGSDFTDMLYDTGCVEVGMGIESGSNKILDIINKGESIETIKAGIKILQNSGIRVKGFFIIGLPGEDKTTLKETDDFVSEMNLHDMDFSIFKPYPGSPIYNNKKNYDILWDEMDYSNTFYKGNGREVGGNIRTSYLTNDKIASEMYGLEKKHKLGGVNDRFINNPAC